MLSSRCQEFSSIDCYAGRPLPFIAKHSVYFVLNNFFFVLSTQKNRCYWHYYANQSAKMVEMSFVMHSSILSFIFSFMFFSVVVFYFALSLPRSLAGWLVLFELVFVLFSIKGKYLLLVFYFDVAVAIVLLLVLCSSS